MTHVAPQVLHHTATQRNCINGKTHRRPVNKIVQGQESSCDMKRVRVAVLGGKLLQGFWQSLRQQPVHLWHIGCCLKAQQPGWKAATRATSRKQPQRQWVPCAFSRPVRTMRSAWLSVLFEPSRGRPLNLEASNRTTFKQCHDAHNADFIQATATPHLWAPWKLQHGCSTSHITEQDVTVIEASWDSATRCCRNKNLKPGKVAILKFGVWCLVCAVLALFSRQ